MRITTIFVLTFGLIGAAQAEEWPRWMGPNGNGISTDATLADQWPADGPKRVWSKQVGLGFSTPIALDGKIYLFSQKDNTDILECFDAETGNTVWSQSYDRVEGPGYPGARATPAIDGERIYTYGSAGDLVCRNLADGKLVWRADVLKLSGSQRLGWGQSSCPLIVDDLIYVQSGADSSVAVAINKNTGRMTWKSQATGGASYSAPIMIKVGTRNQLIVFAGNELVAMDPRTGRTIWMQPWVTEYAINAAMPVYRENHLFVSSNYDHGCMMLQLTPTSSRKLWENKDVMCRFQPPILDGPVVYANSEGTLKAMSFPDGKILWSARNLNLGAGGSLLRIPGDKLITLSERGRLTLGKADPAGYQKISEVALFDFAQVWSSPIVYRGKLYAKGEAELVCLDISK